jgi:hypothetical protein
MEYKPPHCPSPLELRCALHDDANVLDKMRANFLFDRDNYSQLLPDKAQLHYVQALSFMDLAVRSLKLAAEETLDR